MDIIEKYRAMLLSNNFQAIHSVHMEAHMA